MTRAQILAELEKTRSAVLQNTAHLRHDLDISAQIRASVAKHAYGWVAGALLVGFLLSKRGNSRKQKQLPSKKYKRGEKRDTVPEVVEKATTLSLLIAGVRMAMPFIKPIVSAYATKNLAQFASRLGK
ncbi:MAG: hypothetical protein ABI615_00815 [Chthoniobacterales bacterium]